MKKKIDKMFLVSKIMASDLAALNCLDYEGNTCHGQSMREQTVLGLLISI